MNAFDRRLTPARPDLAAAHLQQSVEAGRFSEGRRYRLAAGSAPLRREPRPDAPLDTEALFGEEITVYEENEGWAWAQLGADGYVGYLPESALGKVGPDPTHRVAVLRTFLFPGPSIKLPPMEVLPLGGLVSVTAIEGNLAKVAGGFVPAQHLKLIGEAEPDFVAVAERFVGVPYLWGGKTALGLDCSGLAQVSLNAAGIAAPRDSDMQEAALGTAIQLAEIGPDGEGLRRGDLLFWKGHVAIARGDGALIHANAHHMMVAIEPAAEVLARANAAGSPLRAVRRIDKLL
jgi:cell wall-associated NlpC family hydrolase